VNANVASSIVGLACGSSVTVTHAGRLDLDERAGQLRRVPSPQQLMELDAARCPRV
jgi:hypothetical protein